MTTGDPLAGRTVAVTGASGGLGKALLAGLRKRGALAQRIERGSTWEPGDFELVFLNAGFGMLLKADSMVGPDAVEMFRVNLLEPLRQAQRALAGGCLHVHLVGSVLSHVSAPHFSLYAATKHALRGWAYGAARELPGRVSISYPNGMKSRFMSSLRGDPELLGPAQERYRDAWEAYDLPETVAEGILEGLCHAAREIIPSQFALDWFVKNEVDVRRMWHPGLAEPSVERWDWWEAVKGHWRSLGDQSPAPTP